MKKLTLYSYFQSSASYRVRIALHHKGLPFEYRGINLRGAGDHNKTEYRDLNPMGEIPTLVITENGKDQILSQSMAIFLYLDTFDSRKRLFPQDPFLSAKLVQFCENINAGIHPVQNLKVRQYLATRYKADEKEVETWCAHWIARGFQAIEKTLNATAGKYCFGDEITAADMFLVPQAFNAHRYKVDMAPFPKILEVEKNCLELEAFKKSIPSAQPDFTT
jgi:maleylacetoacetate isomerase